MADEHGSALSLFGDREFLALAGTTFARSQAYSTLLIALALYADIFGTTGTIEGLFGTGMAAVQLLIVLPLGRAIDVSDSKRWLVAGLLVNIAVFFGFVFVSDPVHVVLVRVAQGVGASILWITGTSVIGEIAPEDARGRWLGSYNQVTAFSSFAGDLVGGLLLTVYGFTATYTVLSGVTLLATVLVYRFLRDNPGGSTTGSALPYAVFVCLSANAVAAAVVAYFVWLRLGAGLALAAVLAYTVLSAVALVAAPRWLIRRDEEAVGITGTLRALLGRPVVRSLVVFRMSFAVGKMAVIIFLPIYARTEFGISAVAIGGILAGGKLCKALLQGKMGDWTDAFGHEHLFVAGGAVCYAVGTAMIPLAGFAAGVVPAVSVPFAERTFSPAYVTLFAAYGVIGVADSIRLPASMSLFVAEGEAEDSVASSMSLRSVSWKLGQVVGPVGVGFVMDTVSTLAAFWTAAGFIVVATGVFLVLYREAGTPTAA